MLLLVSSGGVAVVVAGEPPLDITMHCSVVNGTLPSRVLGFLGNLHFLVSRHGTFFARKNKINDTEPGEKKKAA